MAVDDLGNDVGEVSVRFDATELTGLNQRRDHRPVLAATIGACKQRILPVQSDWSDRAFDDIGVDLDAPVIDEAG